MNESAAADRIEQHRKLLLSHAYRMLGSYADAEDIVQDAFLRFAAALPSNEVRDDRAYLRTMVTRLCIDKLRSAARRREQYIGPWLPELIVSEEEPGDELALADDVSLALLLALERLAPLERAAFLLHDALGVPFDEVAQTLGRSDSAVRKLASRARERIHDANRHSGVPRSEALRLRDALLAALRADDVAAVQDLLAEDVVLTSDGGGRAAAAMVPVAGAGRVGRMLLGLSRKGSHLVRRIEFVVLNGLPGIVVFEESGITSAMAIEAAPGRIVSIYMMRNPDKLQALATRLSV